MSTASSPTKPLATRNINTSPPKPKSPEKAQEDTNKSKSMEYHRQVLQNRLAEEKSSQVYISPSDTIMSPCTKKLNGLKTKHYMKAKPQSLFAKMDAGRKVGGEGSQLEESKDGER